MKNKEVEQSIQLIDNYLFGTNVYHDFQLEKVKNYIERLEKENLRLSTQNSNLKEWKEKFLRNI